MNIPPKVRGYRSRVINALIDCINEIKPIGGKNIDVSRGLLGGSVISAKSTAQAQENEMPFAVALADLDEQEENTQGVKIRMGECFFNGARLEIETAEGVEVQDNYWTTSIAEDEETSIYLSVFSATEDKESYAVLSVGSYSSTATETREIAKINAEDGLEVVQKLTGDQYITTGAGGLPVGTEIPSKVTYDKVNNKLVQGVAVWNGSKFVESSTQTYRDIFTATRFTMPKLVNGLTLDSTSLHAEVTQGMILFTLPNSLHGTGYTANVFNVAPHTADESTPYKE